MLAEQRYEFSEDARTASRDHLERRMQQPRFANARRVRNALKRARLRRIVTAGGKLTRPTACASRQRTSSSPVFFDGDEGASAKSELAGVDGTPPAEGDDEESPKAEAEA